MERWLWFATFQSLLRNTSAMIESRLHRLPRDGISAIGNQMGTVNFPAERSSTQMRTRFGPSGVHLFDRQTGLNVLVDEIVPLPSVWSRAPRNASIALTNACDLSCQFCYAPKHKASLNYQSVTGWMTELDKHGCLGIGFGGGEPTLHPRFADLCRFGAQETQLAISFTTHGHRLTDSLLSRLRGFVHFVRVSVDGVDSIYEAIRGRSFTELADRVHRLRDISRFGINFVVNSLTFPEIDRVVEFATEAGASEFLLLPERPTTQCAGVDSQVILQLRDWTKDYRGSMRLSIAESGSEAFAICDPFRLEQGLRSYAHIDASGILRGTSYDPEGVRIDSDGVMAAMGKLCKLGH